MSVHFVTGDLGGGKTLAAIKRIQSYVRQGRKVATNLDLYMEELISPRNKMTPIRLPDHPRIEDLMAIGKGHDGDGYNRKRNGLLVLDELGSYFNSRSWNEDGRQEVLDYMRHARKWRWDIIFIVQDISIIDKQLRLTLCQFLVVCKDMGELGFPFVNTITRFLFDYQVTLPSFHKAKVHSGDSPSDYVCDVWTYRATDLYKAYDTEQVIIKDEKRIDGQLVDMRSSYCLLSAWHLKGRYQLSLFKRILNFLAIPLLVFVNYINVFFSPAPRRAAGEAGEINSFLVSTLCDENKPLLINPDNLYLFPEVKTSGLPWVFINQAD